MSSRKDGSGCGCLLLILVLVVLAATKPDEAAHRAAFANRTPVLRALFGVQEVLGTAKLEYHDYFFFSVMTAKFDGSDQELLVTTGFLGKVHYGNDK